MKPQKKLWLGEDLRNRVTETAWRQRTSVAQLFRNAVHEVAKGGCKVPNVGIPIPAERAYIKSSIDPDEWQTAIDTALAEGASMHGLVRGVLDREATAQGVK